VYLKEKCLLDDTGKPVNAHFPKIPQSSWNSAIRPKVQNKQEAESAFMQLLFLILLDGKGKKDI
jgi:hypothetical protein